MNPEDDNKIEPILVKTTDDFIKEFGVRNVTATSPVVSIPESDITNYVSRGYLHSLLLDMGNTYVRREPTTMVPVGDALLEVKNSELSKLFQDHSELEQLCEEIPAVKEAYDRLQSLIKLYRE